MPPTTITMSPLFPAYLSALHSRLDDGEQRRAVLRNLCGEEIEGVRISELWLDFAEGMGADRDEVRGREPLPEVSADRRISAQSRARDRRPKRWPRFMPTNHRFRVLPERRPMAWHSVMAPMPKTADISSCISLPTWSTRDVWRELLSAEIARAIPSRPEAR